MKIVLHIEYQAQWGAQLYVVTGRKPSIGATLPRTAIEMDNDGRGNWFVEVEAAVLAAEPYHYVLAYQRRVVRNEFGNGHRIAGLTQATDAVPTLRVWDIWRRMPLVRSFFSLMFRHRGTSQAKGFSHLHDTQELLDELLPDRLTLVCEAPPIADGQTLALIGNDPLLGEWDPERAVVMQQLSNQLWAVTISRLGLHFPLRYKFVLLDQSTRRFIAWEDCTNRYFEPSAMHPGDSLLICDQRFKPTSRSEVEKNKDQ